MINKDLIWEKLKNRNLVVYDLETSGFKSKTTRILSFSAIRFLVTNSGLIEIDRRNIFINPMRAIPASASEVNHITNEMVADCPTEYEVGPDIIKYLNSADVVAGYNSHTYDNWHINEMSKRIGLGEWAPKEEVDVMVLAKEIIPKDSIENYKLGTLTRRFNAAAGLTFHNSIDDVIATSRVLLGLIKLCRQEDDCNNVQKAMVPLPTMDMPEPVNTPNPMLDPNIWITYSDEDITGEVNKSQLKSEAPLNKALMSSLWEKSDYLRRLYIKNSLDHNVYYDIVKEKWVYDYAEDKDMIDRLLDRYDLDDLIDDGRTRLAC